MFGLFKKQDPRTKLYKKHERLLKEAYQLASSNRKASDTKYAEAEEIMKQIEALDKQA